MSTFSGPQGKGAMRRHREILRDEAADRRESFKQDVARVAQEQNISLREARRVAAASRRTSRRVAEKVGGAA